MESSGTLVTVNCLAPAGELFTPQLKTRLCSASPAPLSDWTQIDQIFKDYRIWNGKWTADTRERLKKQVETGETVVYVLDGEFSENGPDPRIVRASWVVALDVFSPDSKKHLLEFTDKDSPELKPKMEAGGYAWGISEKRPVSETVQEAALRALDEELGISHVAPERLSQSATNCIRVLYKPDERNFWVALVVQHLSIQLLPEEYRETYVEERNGRRNEFRWIDAAD